MTATDAKSVTVAFDVESRGAAAAATAAEDRRARLRANLLTLLYFLAWFILSVVFNIYNKKALQALAMPYLVAEFQLFAGIPIIAFFWLTKLRKTPILDWQTLKPLVLIAVFHCGTHLAGILAMDAGAVSFAHIIKSGEPFSTAILSAVLLRTYYSWQVYVTLIPVCAGIAMASVSELSFTWKAFATAVISAVSGSLRGIYSKEKLKDTRGRNLEAQNLYSVLTIISFILLLPVGVLADADKFVGRWTAAMNSKDGAMSLVWLAISGVSYFLYNEFAFLALESVSPVTHAVGSTFKRVFVIGTAIVVFRTPVSLLGWIGSSTAVIGVLVFSLAKTRYSPPKKAIDPVVDDSPTKPATSVHLSSTKDPNDDS